VKNFDGIIFDIDGTLTSTFDLIFASFNYVTEKYFGKTYTNEEIQKEFGPTEDVILKKWFKDRYDIVRKDYYQFYDDKHHEMADVFPGMPELLKNIKERDIILATNTGKGRDSSLITLNKLGIRSYFDLVVTGDEVEDHKPAPDGIFLFLEKYNIPKERVLMIGDMWVDIAAAQSAGVKSAAVLYDDYAKHDFKGYKPDYSFHTVEELSKFILENIH